MNPEIQNAASEKNPTAGNYRYLRWFSDLTNKDVPVVGGKTASLGEMIRHLGDQGIRVPDGFAVTADAYRDFLTHNQLEGPIRHELGRLDSGESTLAETGRAIRAAILAGEFSADVRNAIQDAYGELSRRYGFDETDVAVRSSATAEDLPDASFAGQQETFLNVHGRADLLDTCRRCLASLFTDRAISYRQQKGFAHMDVALSIAVQKMVRSDTGSSGVMFTLDTETGFPDMVVINATWGLGENIVQGAVTPDEFRVFKPPLRDPGKRPIVEKILGEKEIKMIYASERGSRVHNVRTGARERRRFSIDDDDVIQLARWACLIEKHYQRPMDIEWGRDGTTGELFILQARPETVESQKNASTLKTSRLKTKGAKPLVEGLAIGGSIATGKVRLLKDMSEADQFAEGEILVTELTDPDWVPVMKKAAGIVTDHGGRTSHAAIVSRELGVPAVVGTGGATGLLVTGQEVTLSCVGGERGVIYQGILDYEESEIDLREIPETRTRIMLNIATPEAAFRWWRLPCSGIGLARMEFIISNLIQVHPMALVGFDDLKDDKLKATIARLTAGWSDKSQYFVDKLASGVARIAASQYPEPVIVRLSDFKTNEYAELIGGHLFEPKEENPMLGFRGASRYYSPEYRPGFDLECRALRHVRNVMGLDNVIAMIPFCRTLEEADSVLEVMAENGLARGKDGLEIYVMAEIPSNIILASQFAERFDGFSIGSNDLTQLLLGVDRDSGRLAHLFDERNEAVKEMIRQLITKAHQAGVKVGICGQAPSDHPGFAEFLVEAGIDSISLNPDSVIGVKKRVAAIELGSAGPITAAPTPTP